MEHHIGRLVDMWNFGRRADISFLFLAKTSPFRSRKPIQSNCRKLKYILIRYKLNNFSFKTRGPGDQIGVRPRCLKGLY